MTGTVVTLGTVKVVMVGIEFMQYATHYQKAAELISTKSKTDVWFDPLPYQLLCQALELHLKSYVWLTDKHSRNKIKNKYGHDIEKLWRHSKQRGLNKYCIPTILRNETIQLVGPYYKSRKFTYLDLPMSWEGIPSLRAQPKSLAVLMRLCKQLEKSLNKPILSAS